MKTEINQTGITIEGLIKVEELKAILAKYPDNTLFVYIYTMLDENNRLAHPICRTAKNIKEGIAELQDNEMLCYHHLSTDLEYTETPYGKIEKELKSFKHELEKIGVITYLAQDCIEDFQRLLGDDRTEESIDIAKIKYGYKLSTMAGIYRYTRDPEEIARILSTMCVALMYSTWENKYRDKIAGILNCKSKEIKCDIMGDLRKIRNYLVHDANNVGKLKILNDILEDTGTTTYEKIAKIIEKTQETEPNQIQICYLTNDVKQVVDNISTSCEKYMAAVSEGLIITGSPPEKTCHILNKIKEDEQMIIKHVLDSASTQ